MIYCPQTKIQTSIGNGRQSSWSCWQYTMKGMLISNVWIKEEELLDGQRVKPTEKFYGK
jgi:hypothetical protein